MAITAEDSFYILLFDRDVYNTKVEEGAEITDECVEEAFEVVAEMVSQIIFYRLTTKLTNPAPNWLVVKR